MNTVKSLIPNLFYLLGYCIAILAKLIAYLSIGLYIVGNFLHIKLKTITGIKLLIYKEELEKIEEKLQNFSKKYKSNPVKVKVTESSDRLVKILKGGNEDELDS